MPAKATMSEDWIPAAGLGEDVVAGCTTRSGGVSVGPFATFNTRLQTGDDPHAVAENRRRLAARLGTGHVQYLNQVHGTAVVRADVPSCATEPDADAVWTDARNLALVIQTADCLPVLIAHPTRIGAAHAGWRGLAAGVLEGLVAAMAVPASEMRAWIGPAIGGTAYEVGDDVRLAFGDADRVIGFRQGLAPGKWWCDLAAIAAARLAAAGLLTTAVSPSGLCTLADRDRFFSYRRDGETGRLASVILRR